MALSDASSASPIDQTQIKVGIAKKLLTRAPTAAISALVFALFSAVILSFHVPVDKLLIWLTAIVGCAALPAVYMMVQTRYPISVTNVRRYLLANSLSALCTGLTWGIGMVLLTDLSSFVSIMVTFLVVMAFSTAAIISHGVYPPSYMAAAGTALLTYGTYLTASAPTPGYGFGLVALGALVPYLLAVRHTNRIAVSNIVSRLQQQTLLGELKAQRDEIEKVNSNKTRFLAATSHDLAQPLHAQGNYIAALRSKLNTPEQTVLLDKIESSWRGMGNLLDGLVDISRLDAGAIIVHPSPVELSSLTRAIVDEFAGTAHEKSVKLLTRLDKQVADTDVALFSRVLRNVLSNAIKFTPSDGTVEVSLSEENGHLVLTVEDSGLGIARDKHDDVFEEYVQLQNPERDRQKGLGLGLSIVKRLCELLDIKMQFRSEPGSGTRFAFLIVKSNVSAENITVHAESFGALRLSILVVDDERSVLDSMSVILSDWGCEVFCARSCDEAILLLQTLGLKPDVVIADLRLRSEQTGNDCIDRIRVYLEQEIPALIMTGNVDGADIKGLPAATRVLMKPVEAATMYAALKREVPETAMDDVDNGAKRIHADAAESNGHIRP
jgi:signal transduction histidine kinase/FixJ family two-component response regulator